MPPVGADGADGAPIVGASPPDTNDKPVDRPVLEVSNAVYTASNAGLTASCYCCATSLP